MSNMVDYIKWRGDITFAQDPFNEIDNVILSELCYTSFDGIVPGPEIDVKIPLSLVYEQFFEKYDRKELLQKKTSLKVPPFLMDELVKAERFQNMYLTGYVNEVVSEEEFQFSAVTFILDDGTYFVAYRGTDSTITGWKEDINMGYLYQTPGQLRAAKYLNDNFKDKDCKLRVGGHSKGGNFAVYASSFCDESIQDKIITVYTNDGPGFREEVVTSDGYNRILPKIFSTVPGSSVVGLLLENNLNHNVVRSENEGLAQHDIMSWNVYRNRFIRCASVAESSINLDKTLTSWLSELSEEDRKTFIDALFKPLEDTGITTIDELSKISFDNIKAVKAAYDKLPEEQHAIVKGSASKFISIYFETVFPKKENKESSSEKKSKIGEFFENRKKKKKQD